MSNTETIRYVELPHPDNLLMVETLDYNNPYDYKKMHRHDYFEIILINEGEGNQLIDFSPYNISAGKMFIVYPGQVHLMNRHTANGLLLQFKKDLFEYIYPVRHYHLYTATSVEAPKELFDHLYELAFRMYSMLKQKTQLSQIAVQKAYSYLQIILISLIEASHHELISDKERNLIGEYLSLVSAQVHTKKKVSEYCSLMGCNAEKLNDVCRKNLGKTALELIHEELMLEIRRLLLLDELSLKEIAYHLNFDSPANFSSFIKNKTGLTPTELQRSVSEIYK